MLDTPAAEIDLPLKILVSEDGAGDVVLSYNRTSHLQGRYGFHRSAQIAIDGIEALAKSL